MNPRAWIARNRWFAAALAVAALLLAAEATATWHFAGRRNTAARSLRARSTELSNLQRVVPRLDAAAERAGADELAAVRAQCAAAVGRCASPAAAASSDGDAFLETAECVARMRTVLTQAGVGFPRDTRFGFKAYAHEAPPADRVPELRRHLALAERVLTHVAAAGADEVTDVRRGARDAGADGFVPDARVVHAIPGLLDSATVRVEFVGDTEALRRFVADLSATEPALLLATVEAQRLPGKPGEPGPGRTRFSVTVEQLTRVEARKDPR